MRLCIALAFLCLAAPLVHGEELDEDADTHGDVEVAVALDPGGQSGRAEADVRIHAPQDVVWSLITSCAEMLHLVPGLVRCDVLETAKDLSWQRIRHVLDYSWYVPKLTYELRATYDKPRRASIRRLSGDLKTLDAAWALRTDGDSTIAHYSVDLAPGFWVPRWLVRNALKRDLPKMMRSLRARAEGIPRKP